jgi:histidinol-phosphate aminotransferase
VSDLDLSRLLPKSLEKLSAYIPPEGNFKVRLDANESPYPPDPVVVDEIGKALVDMPLNRYPDPGSRDLRSAFAERFGCRVENVMAGNGSDELIGLLIWTLRGNRQEGQPVVVVPAPTFAMYSIAAQAAGYEVCEVPLGAGLKPDIDAMLRAVREKNPSIIFISNPNNPTGTHYSKEQIQMLLDESTGLVVVDEAYGDFSGDTSWTPEVITASNLAVLRTLSKVGGAALRCGFLAAGRELLQEVNKVRSPFNLSRYTQIAGEAFLRNYDLVRSQVAATVRERDRLAGHLKEFGLQVFPSRGNFLFVQCGGREEALWRFLQENSIVVKFLVRLPVTGDALRITVGAQEENDLLLSRVRDFLAEGGKDA